MTPSPAALSGAQPAVKVRLQFVDNLRVLLTMLVVAHHAAQAYGPTGGAWPVGSEARSPLLGLLITVNSMFFMGLFFFVSGYFTPGALERKGPRAFLVDRIWRFGIPCALVLVLTSLFLGKPEFLHLWFIVDLLALNALYALVAPRLIGASSPGRPSVTVTGVHLALFILAIAALTAVVRAWYRVDEWVNFLWLLPIEPAHWVQYGALYGAGLWAARSVWLARLPERLGASSLIVAGALIAGFAAYRFWPDRDFSWFDTGGANARNVAYALLENALGVTLGLGLLWLFRRHFDRQPAWAAAFSADAYGIYCIHLPIVIAAQLLIAPWSVGPLVKFTCVTVLSLAGSWAATRWLLRSTALGRRIF